MSMHKLPLSRLEEEGLKAHGLSIETPSQLSDAFRQGITWALSQQAEPVEPAHAQDERLRAAFMEGYQQGIDSEFSDPEAAWNRSCSIHVALDLEQARPAKKVNVVDTPEQQPVAVPESWWQLIHDTLRNYCMSTLNDGYGGGYPLTDAMTADGQSVSGGIEECTYLADAIWNALRAAPIAQTAPQPITEITACHECGSKSLTWQSHNRVRLGCAVQQGRLNTNEVECLFVIGCDDCSETLKIIIADEVAAALSAHQTNKI